MILLLAIITGTTYVGGKPISKSAKSGLYECRPRLASGDTDISVSSKNVASFNYKPLDKETTPNPVSNQTSSVYRVHGHWAKRPYNVVRSCIEHFTNPGEIVFDPFVGFGTTGIEALRARRKAVIFDINPMSVFIAKTLLMPISHGDLEKFEASFDELKAEAKEKIDSLFMTICPKCRREAIISTTIYDSKNDVDDPRERVYIPRKISFSCKCGNRGWKKPDKSDVKEIERLASLEPESWYPKAELVPNSRINVHQGMTIADLYTKRNLNALSILRNALLKLFSGPVERLMKFTFSGILRSASQMVHEGGGGWQNNFHIPKRGLAERNVWDVFSRKKDAVVKCKKRIQNEIGDYYNEAKDFSEIEGEKTIMIKKWDATEATKLIPKRSIDYVHTDPPYGDNIPYLELFLPNVFWIGLDKELDRDTWHNEIVITDSPDFADKNIDRYRNRLIESFVNISKVIKKGRWVTSWFACLDDDIWKALTDSFQVGGLEKKESYLVWRTAQQRSFSIKARSYRNPLARVLNQDLLAHCQKTGNVKLAVPIPRSTAFNMFVKIAESEIMRKGSTTSGEIYITLANECLRKFSTPPPNLDYEKILKSDPRFVLEEATEVVGKKTVKTKVWKLKGFEHPKKLTYYLGRNDGQ